MSELLMPEPEKEPEANFVAFLHELATPLPCHTAGEATCCRDLGVPDAFERWLAAGWVEVLAPRSQRP